MPTIWSYCAISWTIRCNSSISVNEIICMVTNPEPHCVAAHIVLYVDGAAAPDSRQPAAMVPLTLCNMAAPSKSQ